MTSRTGPRRAIDVSVDAKDFVDLLGATSKVPQAVRTQMRKQLRAGAAVAQKAVQAEVRRALGKRNYGVRQGIANAVRVEVNAKGGARVGVSIVVSSKNLPANRKPMVRLLNRPSFRHPVFARYGPGPAASASTARDRRRQGARARAGWTWVVQQGHPYFDEPIQRQLPAIQALVNNVLDDAAAAAGVTRHR